MSEYTDYLSEIFARFGAVQIKRMFGGHGVYYDGLMFALVSDDTLYLKADADNAPFFDGRSLPGFTHTSPTRTITLPYRLAPPEIMDDAEEAAAWARRSYEAALRAAAKKTAKPSRKTKKPKVLAEGSPK